MENLEAKEKFARKYLKKLQDVRRDVEAITGLPDLSVYEPILEKFGDISVAFDRRFKKAPLNFDEYYHRHAEVPAHGDEPPGSPAFFKRWLLNDIDVYIEFLNNVLAYVPKKNLQSILFTEKELLSEKVPPGVSDKIASYLTGKEGSIPSQKHQLKEDAGHAGGSRKMNKKSNRKTRKRRM
jgi:hypothetical protein